MALDPTAKQAALIANSASSFIGAGQYAEGIDLLRQAIALTPRFVEAHINLGLALYRAGHLEDAVRAFETAIELRPDFALAYFNLAGALRDLGRLAQAVDAYRRAIVLKPDYQLAYENLAITLQDQGHFAEAVTLHQKAIEMAPDRAKAHSALVYTLTAGQLAPPSEILAAARRYGALLPPSSSFPGVSRGHPLRIGILTAELSGHPVSIFLEAYLRHYDRSRCQVLLYLTKQYPGLKTDELTALADGTKILIGISDSDAVAQIRGDRLDVLIETTSHTRGGRLAILAARCAPVQCHYLGFFGTTGVPTVDYFIGDDEVTPPDFDGHFSERLYRLPRPWVAYTPPDGLPDPAQLSPDDEITLGCFNNLAKVTDATLALWSDVLKAIPNAQLVLKDRLCADPATRARIIEGFAVHSVPGARITFAERNASWTAHMQTYNTIDVALDPVPLCSGTTAFDAILMGTPLVAMRGDWMGGRMSSSVLKALGRPAWIAQTSKDYVRIVRGLVSDKAALRQIKRTLRNDMVNGPLCDGPALARSLETAFEHMRAGAG